MTTNNTKCEVERKLSTTGIITLIQHFSIHDGPGIRTTVFFKGCPLNCWWCHNPENIKMQPEEMHYKTTGVKTTVGKTMDVESIVHEVEKDRVFYERTGGGVTFSGGEPTLQFNFLKELLSLCANRGIHTALDTSGYVEPDKFARLLELTDLFIYDIKLIDDEKHQKYTEVSNTLILANLEYLYQQNQRITLRIPLIHGINDSEKDMNDYIGYLSKFKPRENFEIEILPYHKFGESKYPALDRPYHIKNGVVSKETIEKLRQHIEERGFVVCVNTW